LNSDKNVEIQLQTIVNRFLIDIVDFIKNKKFGSVTFVIQNGEVVGCDILEKKRKQ
jgi:hypothetical protein